MAHMIGKECAEPVEAEPVEEPPTDDTPTGPSDATGTAAL